MIPDRLKKLSTDDFLASIYNVINQLRTTEPIETPASDFPSEMDYGLVVYAKTAVWLHVLEDNIGKDQLSKGMHAYFSDWKFKHPYPEDMEASLEASTGDSLDHFFRMLHSIGSF
jgi:aminopeptidase N